MVVKGKTSGFMNNFLSDFGQNQNLTDNGRWFNHRSQRFCGVLFGQDVWHRVRQTHNSPINHQQLWGRFSTKKHKKQFLVHKNSSLITSAIGPKFLDFSWRFFVSIPPSSLTRHVIGLKFCFTIQHRIQCPFLDAATIFRIWFWTGVNNKKQKQVFGLFLMHYGHGVLSWPSHKKKQNTAAEVHLVCLSNLWMASSACILHCDQFLSRSSKFWMSLQKLELIEVV